MTGKTFEDKINFHIYERIETALRGRSWNWLGQKAGISQSSLQTQKKSDAARAEGVAPRFNIETLLAVAGVLKLPVSYFLPGKETDPEPDLRALQAMRKITEIVDWARSDDPDAPTPAGIGESQSIAEEAREALDPPRRRAARARKQRSRSGGDSHTSPRADADGSKSRPRPRTPPDNDPQ